MESPAGMSRLRGGTTSVKLFCMTSAPNTRSYLAKLKVCNLGCIGPEGIEVDLDDIVCLVGANNSGKSTVLRAYEAAVTNADLGPSETSAKANGAPTTVELWVHIPEGTENIDERWKESVNGMLLVRSKWSWPAGGGKPVRTTWDPEIGDYAEDGKASGLDTVFNSRLPKPFRIGSLDDPEEEHKKLLELVLEPIKSRIVELMKDESSELRGRIRDLQAEAEKPVAAFKADLDTVQSRVNTSYRRVFSSAQIQLSVSLGELSLDPGTALVKASHLGVVESHGQMRWHQQGTGSQRTLFWSMLEVRSELTRIDDERKQVAKEIKDLQKDLTKLHDKASTLKKQDAIDKNANEIRTKQARINALRSTRDVGDQAEVPVPFLPGYMLLIDEPETALHPAAIRAAKDHLYSLAAEAGWQVMLSTHHPAFIDPLRDHTTIVRLHRQGASAAPNVYRADSAGLNAGEKETLKTLLAFDQAVAEMFFANKVIIVEGDSEFAAFTVVMDADLQAFPLDTRPLILRARGKWTIPLLVRMLAHFKVSCAVVHDVDAPLIGRSGRRNSAYSANEAIQREVAAARAAGVPIIHRCSAPDFERRHGMDLPSKDKPFSAWLAVKNDATIRASVRKVLDALSAVPTASDGNSEEDGRYFETQCKAWADTHASGEPEFRFDVST